MFPDSHVFVVMLVTSCIKETCSIYPDLISEWGWNCTTLWRAQHRNLDSQETCYKYKICENGWSNFSENLRAVAIKVLESSIRITKSINLVLIYTVLGSVVILTFLHWPPVHSPFIEKSMQRCVGFIPKTRQPVHTIIVFVHYLYWIKILKLFCLFVKANTSALGSKFQTTTQRPMGQHTLK